MECRRNKQLEWLVRLQEDIRTHKNGKFVTLTFSNESYTKLAKESPLNGYALDNYIAKRAVRLSLENWRKKYKKSLRHWLVTELGHNGTENVHLHGILFINDVMEIDTFWKYGFTWKGKPTYLKGKIIGYQQYVNTQTLNYITKYVTKVDDKHPNYKAVILTSPGIGSQYTNDRTSNSYRNRFNSLDTDETYKTESGHKISLPIYYRNKIYTDNEKELLWLQKLDKATRYVDGQPYDNYDDYFDAVKQARKKSHQLGYGDDSPTWEQKIYEHRHRCMMQKKRFQESEINEEIKEDNALKKYSNNFTHTQSTPTEYYNYWGVMTPENYPKAWDE